MCQVAARKATKNGHLNLTRIVWWWDPTTRPCKWGDISCVTNDGQFTGTRWLDRIRDTVGINIEFTAARELRDTPLGKPSCCPDRFVVESVSPQEVRQRGIPVVFDPDFPIWYKGSFKSKINETQALAEQNETVGQFDPRAAVRSMDGFR